MNKRVQSQGPPVSKPSLAPVRSNLLQRKCACGGTPGLDEECAECRRKRLIGSQGNLSDQADQPEAALIAHEGLRSSDRSLDAETRSFIEARHFGHDFSRIPLYARPSEQIQTNRSNNLPRDKHEQETDQKPAQTQGLRSASVDGTYAAPNSSNWPTSLQTKLEQAFQLSLGSVPLTVDPGLSSHGAAAAADGVGIQVDPRWLDPKSKSGQHLIAHELAHLTHQPHRDPGPGTAERDANAAADRFVRGQRPSLGPTVFEPSRHAIRFQTAVEAAKVAIRMATARWGTDEEAILEALRKLTPAQLAELSEDRAILRLLEDELTGQDLADVGAELARGRVGGMLRPELASIAADPGKHSIGVIAAAKGRDVLLEHQERVAATGTGTIQGNRCVSPLPVGVRSADCTTYVLDVLTSAFAAKGHSSTWANVMSMARTASGPGGLKGTEVLEALQSEAGWEGVFWSPDPRNPRDTSPEHPAAFKQVREQGTYYGITVDPSKSVINYRRTDPAATRDLSGIERLQRLQFGVLATRGGTHMALIINGSVYEVHWDKPASDPKAIEATPLEKFAWQSGVIVAPKGDLERAWNTP
jgi:hypothetical protein